MKNIFEQNYYEILEIGYFASRVDIQRAYELAKVTFAENSLASYTLFDLEEKKRLISKIEEAYKTLINEEKRAEYDKRIEINELKKNAAAKGEEQIVKDDEPAVKIEDLIDYESEISGKDLKKVRELRRMPLQQIADHTRISIRYLEFMEEDDYNGLPEEVYIKSYLLQYAKMLGIDPQKTVLAYLKNYSKNKKKR